MTFGGAIRTCLRKFATFSGRASRSEFWWFVLFLLLVGAGISVVDAAIFGPTQETQAYVTVANDGATQQGTRQLVRYGNGPLSSLWSLVTLLPLLAVTWRRLHDTGRRGWYAFLPLLVGAAVILVLFGSIGLLPGSDATPEEIAGNARNLGAGGFVALWLLAFGSFILLVVWLCRRSDPGPNRYGPAPEHPA